MEQSGMHVEPMDFIDHVSEFIAYTASYLNNPSKTSDEFARKMNIEVPAAV